MDATNAPGYYLFDAAQGEANADCLMVSAKSATANIKVIGAPAVIYTRPTTGWLAPTTAGRTLDVAATGEAGLDFNNILSSSLATLNSLTITGSLTVSDGLLISRSSSNTSAITATGNGTGSGIVATSGSGATGDGIQATSAATNGNGFVPLGTGTGSGFKSTGGATGHGALLTGGGTSGDGLKATAGVSGIGLNAIGVGTTMPGIKGTGGATTSAGMSLVGGGTSGDGLLVTATSGHGFNIAGGGTTKHGIFSTGGATTSAGMALAGGGTSGDGLLVTTTSGHGINLAPVGTSKHGLFTTGGNGGTSDGISAVAGTGGVPIRGDITGNITGTLSTVTTLTNLPSITAGWLTATGIAADAITAAKVAADVGTEIGTAVWATATRTLTAGTNIDGSTFSAIPWNPAWDDEVQSEVNDGLVAYDAATGTDVSGLNNLSAAQVNAEVVDALATDTYAEPTGAPAATASLSAKINRIYQALRNRIDVSATDKTFYNDAGSALWTKALSDDGTTYTEAEGS